MMERAARGLRRTAPVTLASRAPSRNRRLGRNALGVIILFAVGGIAGVSSLAQTGGAAPAEDPSRFAAARLTGTNTRLPTQDLMKGRRRFEAGSHTAWHAHPAGQLILVEEGVGFVQRSGEPIRVLRAGESDFTPAGVPHWHGAAPNSGATTAMIHFGGIGPFLDTVSPAEYAAHFKHPERPVRLRRDAKAWPIGSRPDTLNYIGATSTPPADDMEFARGLFSAGGRTYWHTHPTGQLILAEKGKVLIQRRGEPAKLLLPGQTDFTRPGVPHWHGAPPNESSQTVVVNFGGTAVWGEAVTDQQYAAAAKGAMSQRRPKR